MCGTDGPLMEKMEGKKYPGIAYIVKKEYWKQGYAVEGAKASIDYLFNEKGVEEVIAQIKYDNESSLGVAKKLGMTFRYEYVKIYEGGEMPHLVFSIKVDEFKR